ncbi:MAG: hypothetical protein HY646_15340 [Acidobacteria bacterium]|nr:hypothetical protein [Acidobacteriota bacterium]
MKVFSRLAQYHDESRSAFVLFTELAAFLCTIAGMVGIGFLREIIP